MHNLKRVCLLLILIFLSLATLLAVVNKVLADAVPNPESAAADGRNVGPVELTDIQMVSETVLMEVQPVSIYAPEFNPLGSIELSGAKVTADFDLYNPRSDPQDMPVGFPLFISGRVDSRFYSEIWNLRAFVNGIEVSTTEKTISGADWSIWPMTFSPGSTVLRVTYDVVARQGAGGGPVAMYGYVLRTGAAWAGPIGQGDLIVRFPYPAEPTFIDSQGTLPGYAIDGSDVKWHFENLEPTEANDLALKVVHPDVWRDVARARQAVNSDRTAENYWNLAQTYGGIISEYYVLAEPDDLYSFYSPLLAQTAEAQYLKAIELDPNNRELRQEFTDYVVKWQGLLLPANESLVLTQIASTPTPSTTPLPTRTALPLSATPPTIEIAQASPTPKETTAMPLPATPTSAARISGTPTPTPARRAALIPTSWLIGGTIVVIVVGLWLALRRPAKT